MNYAQSCFNALERRRRIALVESIVESIVELEDTGNENFIVSQCEQAEATLRDLSDEWGVTLKWLWSPSYGQHETLYAVDRGHALERLESYGQTGGTLMVHPDCKREVVEPKKLEDFGYTIHTYASLMDYINGTKELDDE